MPSLGARRAGSQAWGTRSIRAEHSQRRPGPVHESKLRRNVWLALGRGGPVQCSVGCACVYGCVRRCVLHDAAVQAAEAAPLLPLLGLGHGPAVLLGDAPRLLVHRILVQDAFRCRRRREHVVGEGQLVVGELEAAGLRGHGKEGAGHALAALGGDAEAAMESLARYELGVLLLGHLCELQQILLVAHQEDQRFFSLRLAGQDQTSLWRLNFPDHFDPTIKVVE